MNSKLFGINSDPELSFEALINAINDGNLEAVDKLYNQSKYYQYQNFDVNPPITKYGYSPNIAILDHAIKQNQLAIVTYLIDSSPNTYRLTDYLKDVVDTNNVEMLQYFLTKIDFNDKEVFHSIIEYAIENDKEGIVNYLLLTYPIEFKKYYVDHFIVGATIALKGIKTSQGQLPIHVIEDILQRSYNVEGVIGLQQTIDIISDIFDR